MVTFYYNPDTDQTCIDIQYMEYPIDYVISGHYTTDTGYSKADIQKSKLVFTCDDFIPSKYVASDYTTSTSDPLKKVEVSSALGALAALAIIPLCLVIAFCNCLKRRKDPQGNWAWVCRKRFFHCKCLCSRPRSYEESARHKKEKTRLKTDS